MSIWQTKTWSEMLKKSNQADEIFEVRGFFIEKRKVAMGEYGLFILGVEKPLSEKNVNELIKLCKKEKCLFIQFETLSYNSDLNIFDLGENSKFKKGEYKKFITPFTSVIDLNLSEDDILKKMKPKGRYNIKLAGKKSVKVLDVEKTDLNIKSFYDLMKQTTSRDSFNGNNIDYYKIFLNTLKNSKLLLAYVDDVVVAGGIFTFEKGEESIYYYGASTSDKNYRNLMAPYLLQWEAIKIAKAEGSLLYDFLGVATPGKENDPLAGVTDFKKKLSLDIREVSDSYIYINKKIKYFIIMKLRKLKGK